MEFTKKKEKILAKEMLQTWNDDAKAALQCGRIDDLRRC